MSKPQSITDLFGEVISRYTRAQAIEDGFLAGYRTMKLRTFFDKDMTALFNQIKTDNK